jgi:selenocysteine lyase/cysteine desulfurase
VPLVTGEARRYANLDYAASAPSLKSVADHVTRILPYYASVHRGAGYLSQVSTSLYEGARAAVAEFVCARTDDVVVFTRNTTDSLNLLARCVPHARSRGSAGAVVVLDIEHHANFLPWRQLPHRIVQAATTLDRTVQRLEAELKRTPAALLAVTGASNVTGEQLPLGRLAALAHRYGARIAVDAAQLAPHAGLDLIATDVDYVAFSGHKMYAPWGAGVLVGRRDWLDTAPAYLAGGGAVKKVTTSETTWADAPARHEAGSPNVLGVAALARACSDIGALTDGALETHESALRELLADSLRELPGVTVHRLWPDSGASIGIVAFSLTGHCASFVASYLSAEHGIGVRDGAFCAHPLLARLGEPSGALRASIGLGTVRDDVDRLVSALEQLIRFGPQWSYETLDGKYHPVPDPRPVPDWVPNVTPAEGEAPCQADRTS